MKTDIEISKETPLKPISEIAQNLNLSEEDIILYGKYKAKIQVNKINAEKSKKGNLILVTATSPTKTGIGKTVTSVSLALGLNAIGKKSIVALREPSLGPVFGKKGGAAGGGYAQVLPMEDINLHFTGDFHAITSANNMIAALLDNYQFNNKNTDKKLKKIVWKRVLDVNDRDLRYVTTGLGGPKNGVPKKTGFDITPASEIMAILCLSKDVNDLKERINNIVLGYKKDNSPLILKELGIADAITILLKDAILPNLVQTTENTPAIIHGGPFANIAHGCNSVIATQTALSLGDYVVTEAGFGSDLGAEKFFNIKCRTAGLNPKVTVMVATILALKNQSGMSPDEIAANPIKAIEKGLPNMQRHIENTQSFGQKVIIALNRFPKDTDEEIQFVSSWCKERKIPFAMNDAFSQGGKGAKDLAQKVVEIVENNPSEKLIHTYELTDSVEDKIKKIAEKIYRATGIELSRKAKTSLKEIKKNNWSDLPVCIAKTPYSFSDDKNNLGAPTGHVLHVQELIVNAGSGFIVVVSGDVTRMPGLPKEPAANRMNITDGEIIGLF